MMKTEADEPTIVYGHGLPSGHVFHYFLWPAVVAFSCAQDRQQRIVQIVIEFWQRQLSYTHDCGGHHDQLIH